MSSDLVGIELFRGKVKGQRRGGGTRATWVGSLSLCHLSEASTLALLAASYRGWGSVLSVLPCRSLSSLMTVHAAEFNILSPWLFKNFYFYFKYVDVLPACMPEYHLCSSYLRGTERVGVCRGQREWGSAGARESGGLLALELQTDTSCYVSTGSPSGCS